ncbi:unnamed protein product [Aphis gossypii]|uniref:Uncharacterized protein n=1 Tax=Aphis gossypii TaxID=80765 RepID=A0A9P0J616_APHGO|nr:unnamed protein product [Aphis gossypii]
MFYFFIVKTEETLTENYIPTPILYKRLCLGVNLNFQCFVMNILVNTDLFGSNKLNCSKDLEDILKQFDTSIICKGYKLKEQLLHSKTTFTDPAGNLRHIMCPLILNQNNDCKYCNKAIWTIMRKRLPLLKNNTIPKIIHILSSPKVQQLRKNHKLTLQRKYRDIVLNKKLKDKLFNMQG